jgi:hypothetical protein
MSRTRESVFMKMILSIAGVVLLVIAAVYFLVPAGQLPKFIPGYLAGSARIHVTHGIAAAVLGVLALVAGRMTRR